jgi:hypothetical protein
MARALIHSHRILRTGSPLALSAIEQVAPAVFASGPHESRGPRYAYVPTIQPLKTLLDNGWGVYEASQQRSRDHTKDPYTKHMLRLRKLDHFTVKHSDQFRDGVPEVVLINAHDGSASYRLFCGWFRFLCSNGLILGRMAHNFTVRHTVGPQTSAEVLAAGEAIVTEQFPKAIQRIEAYGHVVLTDAKKYRLASKALTLRYGDTVAPFPTMDLLKARRQEDAGSDLWSVLNVVQENIMDGGWETKSAMFGRKSTVRPVERVTAVLKINTGLWDEADLIAEEN